MYELLAHDPAIQNLDRTGSINEMQESLKKALVMEFLLREIEADIAHGTISQCSALYLIINTIPCIFHLEDRAGLIHQIAPNWPRQREGGHSWN
jgi:hypothetical protein